MFFVPPRGRKSIKNRPKIVSENILNEESKRATKNGSKSAQHGSKIAPSWAQIRPKSGQDPSQDPPRAPRSPQEPPRPPKTPPKTPRPTLVAASPQWPRLPARPFLTIFFRIVFQCLLGSVFGSIFGRFWVPKSTQNRSRIGLKSEEAKKAKMLKKPLVFQCFLCLQGVENQ